MSVQDVVVVGGGIVGCAAAAFLAESGARVTLVDGQGLASGASGANSGVVQHPFDPPLAVLYRESLDLYRRLSDADAGFRLAPEPAGLLYLSSDEAAVRRLAADLGTAFPDLDHDVVGGSALTALEPGLAAGLWACRVGMGFPVQPGGSTYGYATLAERAGVVVRLGHAATLEVDGAANAGVRLAGERLAADLVLVAAGPWSASLIDPSGGWAPVRPSWGVVVEVELATARPSHVLEEAEIGAIIGATGGWPAEATGVDFSLVPFGGIATVGSTFLPDEPEPRAWMERLLEHATAFWPAVADQPIRSTRACARPASLDGRPLIGAVPGRPGLYICAGHGPWGISTGPASARLVVDRMLGRSPGVPPEFDAARFGSP